MATTRRYFLKSSGLALAGLAAAPSFLVRTALAQTNAAPGKDQPIIIAIFQRGAADGISIVAPFGDEHYYSARPQIAIPEPKSGAAERAIDLDGFFGLHGGLAPTELEEAFADLYKETFEAVKMLRNANPEQYAPAKGVQYPNTAYGQALLEIAQLIKANVGLEVAFADVGGWDTHANQGSSRGPLANRLKDFGDGLAALYRDLGDRMRNVVIVTMTEFGRAIHQNGSGGTDHGHASCMFVAGGPVKGGQVYGKWPGLAPEQLYEGRDLALTTDFRDLFSEILTKHMGARDIGRIFPGYTPKSSLGII